MLGIILAIIVTENLYKVGDVQVRQIRIGLPIEVIRREIELFNARTLILPVDLLDVQFKLQGSKHSVLVLEAVFTDLSVRLVTTNLLQGAFNLVDLLVEILF